MLGASLPRLAESVVTSPAAGQRGEPETPRAPDAPAGSGREPAADLDDRQARGEPDNQDRDDDADDEDHDIPSSTRATAVQVTGQRPLQFEANMTRQSRSTCVSSTPARSLPSASDTEPR